MKQSSKKTCIFLFFLGIILSSLLEGKVSFSLKGILFIPQEDSFVTPPVYTLNKIIEDMEHLFGKSDILDVHTNYLKKSDSLFGYGGELDFFFNKRISMAIGIEFYEKSTMGDFKAESLIPDAPYTYQRNFRLSMTVIPVLATLRYHFDWRNIDIYPGAGLGYYWVSLEGASGYQDILKEGEDLLWKARGSGFLPHLQLGTSFRILKGLSLGVSLDYTFGTIQKFKVLDSKNALIIGKPLEFQSMTGSTCRFKQSQKGLHASLILKYVF